MTDIHAAGTYKLGHRNVSRLGFGAMQLAGPRVFGPPKDRDLAITVLRTAVARGVDHIDTSDFYGPHVTNRLIAEALWHYLAFTLAFACGPGLAQVSADKPHGASPVDSSLFRTIKNGPQHHRRNLIVHLWSTAFPRSLTNIQSLPPSDLHPDLSRLTIKSRGQGSELHNHWLRPG